MEQQKFEEFREMEMKKEFKRALTMKKEEE